MKPINEHDLRAIVGGRPTNPHLWRTLFDLLF